MAKYLSLITARGGSKEVRSKNIRTVGGRPLLAWTIWHCLSSQLSSDPFVSTNDEEIASIGEAYGAETIWRPDYLCEPGSTTESALIHAIDYLSAQGQHYDYVICLQPTSPIRFSGLLDRCIEQLEEDDADSLLAAWKMYNFLWRQLPSPVSTYIWSSSYNYVHRPMRQDLQPEDYRYFDCGNLYITHCDVLRETQSRLGGKITVYPVNDIENMQLDTEDDLEIFDAVLSGDIRKFLDYDIPKGKEIV